MVKWLRLKACSLWLCGRSNAGFGAVSRCVVGGGGGDRPAGRGGSVYRRNFGGSLSHDGCGCGHGNIFLSCFFITTIISSKKYVA